MCHSARENKEIETKRKTGAVISTLSYSPSQILLSDRPPLSHVDFCVSNTRLTALKHQVSAQVSAMGLEPGHHVVGKNKIEVTKDKRAVTVPQGTYVFVFVFVRVCVRERAKERERLRVRCVCVRERVCVCVSTCLCSVLVISFAHSLCVGNRDIGRKHRQHG